MKIQIKKYIENIKSFNLFNYFIKKRVLSLEYKKEIQEGVITVFKSRILEKLTEKKVLEGKILHARNLITGYAEQLDKLGVIIELYE